MAMPVRPRVARSLSPRVGLFVVNVSANVFIAAITKWITAVRFVLHSSGHVTDQNRCIPFEPSISAASFTSSGICANPA